MCQPTSFVLADNECRALLRTMNIESQELMKRIFRLSDQGLLRVVYIEPAQYRPEAISCAKAEIERRGITFDEADGFIAVDKRIETPLETLGQRIWETMRTGAFRIGFAIGLLPFIWFNIYSYNHMYKVDCGDCFVFFGFPFYLYRTGGFANSTIILWNGLIANVVIAICASIFAGWVLKRSFSRNGLHSNPAA